MCKTTIYFFSNTIIIYKDCKFEYKVLKDYLSTVKYSLSFMSFLIANKY